MLQWLLPFYKIFFKPNASLQWLLPVCKPHDSLQWLLPFYKLHDSLQWLLPFYIFLNRTTHCSGFFRFTIFLKPYNALQRLLPFRKSFFLKPYVSLQWLPPFYKMENVKSCKCSEKMETNSTCICSVYYSLLHILMFPNKRCSSES